MIISRKLNVYELFDILQQEYIICQLRAKIYLKPHLKEYWSKVSEGKRQKVLDIAKRNSLPCIFDHKEIENDYSKKVFRKRGYPNFYYTSEEVKNQQEYWDLWNYYYKKSPVKIFFDDKEPEIGEIVKNNIELKQVTVAIDGREYLVSMDDVTRIL